MDFNLHAHEDEYADKHGYRHPKLHPDSHVSVHIDSYLEPDPFLDGNFHEYRDFHRHENEYGDL